MSTTQTVKVIKNEADPTNRFQAVTTGPDEASGQTVFSCTRQGDMTSWLVKNGYKWVKDTFNPQIWSKP